VPAKKSLLDLIFAFREDLVEHVKVLEDSGSTESRRSAAALAAMTLICQELGEFVSYRLARLPDVAKRHRPPDGDDSPMGALGRRRSQQDMDACHSIGRALDARVSGRWQVETSLTDLYRQLLARAQQREFRPLARAELPASVGRFHKKACAEAVKLRKAGPLTVDGTAAVGSIARKAVGIALAVGGLMGLEQDLVPFTDDVVSFVEVLVRTVDELSVDEDFVPSLPEFEPEPVRQLDEPELEIDGPL
jgi:hypothetical protein